MLNSLQFYRNGMPTVFVPIDEQTIYFDECMGRFDVQTQFYSPVVLDIRTDDYILYNGVRFTVNVMYPVVRSDVFHYTITLEHPSYWLKDVCFKHQQSIEFSYFGTPKMFLELIVENMNVDDTGWMVGACEDVDEKLVEFFASGTGFTCKGALQKIAEEFSLEYWFSGDGKTINITQQAGMETNIHFSYGRSKGLYSVERGMLETPLYNRIYGFGSSVNLAESYRNKADRLTLDNGCIERQLNDGERRRETSIIFEDIFPERTGTLTAISEDWLTLTDSTLDFDLNGNRIEGVQAKVVFKSGELSGQDFDISSYNSGTKTIRIKPNTEKNGFTVPSATFNPVVGDKYTLVGIEQPQSYIDDAEKRLYDAVLKSFKQLTRPPYKVEIDEKYMRENAFVLKSGDRVRLVDDKLGIDDMIRVTSVSFPLVNPNQCTVVISDKITYTQEVQFIIEKDKIKETVKQVDRTKTEQQRVQAMRMRQLQELVFDPDGYFDGTNIRPNSIETIMLAVGAKSQNFYTNGVRIEVNSGDNPNVVVVTAGQIVHRELKIEGLGYIWEIGGTTFDSLIDGKYYFLSAKCSATSLIGQWYLSESPMAADVEVGFIHFNLGVIYAVADSKRDYSFTNGMTYVNGDNITTGKIRAERIDVQELFSQEINAEKLIITGDSRIAGFKISGDSLEPILPAMEYAGKFRIRPMGFSWDSLFQEFVPGQPLPKLHYVSLETSEDDAILKFKRLNNPEIDKGILLDMVGGTAIEILSGRIVVDGSEGLTTKQAISTPNGTRYLNYKSGIMVGISDN
ncbi:phage tail protein [Sphingobacterium psychroaquaticum]|uniref:Tail spike domain-containing protein n=1 Tax=Sphingobacterium psychroaquaticum TaxID=561061 RepID=A0A1X7K3S0_9SPHI|nr:phage tail protein [Sphingobacterium psychroaquaticum]SMG35343.1 hypothetical protein SAMN05660862_2514 [Sphingobacterium psychroaquaticum]